MSSQADLDIQERFYMALADRTRLRLIAMMASGEVCVQEFTHAAGGSQPKISRHLAYLRNSGLVRTRRDGKWIYYSLNWPADETARAALRSAIDWINDAGPGEAIVRSTKAPVFVPDGGEDRSDRPSDAMRVAHNDLEEFLL